jgi:hypothetical protein
MGKSLVVSHTIAFVFGFVAAKLYDRDELNTYRNAYEKPMEKFRRYAGNAVFGAIGLGTLFVVLKITNIGSSKKQILPLE